MNQEHTTRPPANDSAADASKAMAGESEEQAATRTQKFQQSVFEMPINPASPDGQKVTKANVVKAEATHERDR
jgi:hypothetical protein